MPKKSVLLTGATGLLGTQILRKLILQGHKVFAVKRAGSNSNINSELVTWISYDSYSQNLFDKVSQKIDIVIHAAALVSYLQKDKEKIFSVNQDWTLKIANDALLAKVDQFIFISSVSALGKNGVNNIVKEDTNFSEQSFITNYGKSKREAELKLKEMSEYGLPLLILNPSVIIGPANKYQSSAQLFGYISDNKPFFTKGIINYVDARDVAEIILNCVDNEIVNQQYVVSASYISYEKFFNAIAKELKKRPPFIPVPKSLVVFGAIIENLLSKIRSKPPTLSLETAKMAGSSIIYDSSKLKRELNFSFRELHDSIEWTAAEMQKNGEL
ncbi:NAD-dependent epimerase/dehydratase family protein [Marivirga arenosa]|uniref:NAD-dependent epimerase/dehydratase family protein n=1 Tax=Marivirga arenosa TaxID=3059076 RepID=A0AA51RDJ9_9BACT|nr:NAD-dependent epimerase/dehydratase family protein [Marivirga sp. ABR2-2]WMN08014.1 NAD-dependent epimerase/dehydratase family protein [Marivirga sp. ABR2-2]